MPGYFVVLIKLYFYSWCMLKVAQLPFRLGSPRGGHLVNLHDAHISFFLATLLVAVFLIPPHMMLLVTFLVTRILALPVIRPVENAVAVLETNPVSILVPILLTFLVDSPKHLLVQNKIA